MRNIPQIIYLLIDSENNNTDDFNELNAEDIFWNGHSNDSRDPEYVSSELLKEKDEQIKELKEAISLLLLNYEMSLMLDGNDPEKADSVIRAKSILQKHKNIP